GRCGKPPLFYAIETYHTRMLRWLLEIGLNYNERDDFNMTALMNAVEHNNLEAVNVLLEAGTDVNEEKVAGEGDTALREARTREIIVRLLEAGADPQHLTFEGRRALLGFERDPDENLLDSSADAFLAWYLPRFGSSNPEKITSPFWEAMIRAGINAYQA